MSGAYYNENDPFAAAWLRELIKAELIAPGEVDERSIEEVKPDDLRRFTQCHLFAGVGVWSYALRLAGWGDDEPVWSGSCPCPPFSSAGTKKACPRCQGTNPVPHVGRTGYFVCCLCDHEWFADARHLWPELWRLISVCRPVAFFGEQVAGDDGKTWLTLVRASLEILGYAVGAKDLCSAGFGASDIRQRLYFVADPNRNRAIRPRAEEQILDAGCAIGKLGQPDRTRPQQGRQGSSSLGYGSTVIATGGTSELVNTKRGRRNGRQDFPKQEKRKDGNLTKGASEEPLSVLAHANCVESVNGELQRGGRLLQSSENPLAGFWRDAEWIYCRDDKWRAVKPGTFPLVNGTSNRVGRLRGYGNAINAQVAKGFIEAYMSSSTTPGDTE